MRLSASILALTLLVAVTLSCNLAEKLERDGDDSVTASNLWSDVPPFPGATKSNKKLPIRNRFVYNSVLKDKVSFITFSTDKSPQEVKDFYSAKRMNNTGWIHDSEGCFSRTTDLPNGGSLCVFTRSYPKSEFLEIWVQPESTGATIFYMRMDIIGPIGPIMTVF